MTIFDLLLLAGPLTGAGVGAVLGHAFGVVGAVFGAILGGPVGFGLTWLHGRFVLWIVGPDQPEDDVITWRVEARFCEYFYGLGIVLGIFFSWFGTLMTVAFLFDFRVHEPPQLSKWQSVAISAAMGFCGYSLLWTTPRLLNWYLSHRTNK
jgi:hypothetical protein